MVVFVAFHIAPVVFVVPVGLSVVVMVSMPWVVVMVSMLLMVVVVSMLSGAGVACIVVVLIRTVMEEVVLLYAF
jgi:hypothetical protein